ncbi:MAG: hypothetical protein ABI288_09705 [Ginsengibacter sp.]
MRKTICILCFCLFVVVTGFAAAPFTDTGFIQPVSIKYSITGELKGSELKKVVVDYNRVVYVLTDKGVGRISNNEVVKDLRYRPLQDKIPLDITIQEGTGFLYYLYENAFLSNEEAGIPFQKLQTGKYNKIVVGIDGQVLLSGNNELTLFKNGQRNDVVFPGSSIISLHTNKKKFFILAGDGVYVIESNKAQVLHRDKEVQSIAFRNNEIIIGTAHGYYGVNAITGNETFPLQTKIPIQDIRQLITVNGKIWAGTDDGAFTQQVPGSFNYYASKRWLDDNHVINMSADSKGNILLLTPTGLNEIRFNKQTYLNKAKYFEDIIRQRHIRYGLLAEVQMETPGDLTTAEMIDTDNDGLWSSFYLGSQAFRYAVTKDSVAKRYVWECFEAYERLLSINQLKGFPSRTFERKGFKFSDPHAWRPSPDSGWEWKGTTSSDEFVAYIYVAAVMDQFITKSKTEKKRVADFIDKILTHIIDNNYNFVDLDGKPTLWGRWNPDYINWYAKTISDRKLGSTDIIAGLQLGYALTGKEIYKKEAFRLMDDHGYLENIVISPYNIKPTSGYMYLGHDMGRGPWNHSDDEMEFLSYWVLYHYAFNKQLKQKFAEAIREYWKIEAPEKNPAWNLITLGTQGSFDKKATLWYMREFPMDLIRWTIKNSQRKDLTFLEPNFRSQLTKEVLSPAEQPAHRYNSNEFTLDGGNGGKTELSGAEYLLPYWMARYLNVIK